jgi:hypothetical protein
VPDRSLRPRGKGAAAAAVLIVVLAGCGSNGDDATTTGAGATSPATTSATSSGAGAAQGDAPGTDQPLITASINGVFVSGDPAKACEADVTEVYVKTTFGDLAGCEDAQVPGAAADSVDISGIQVSGNRATADAIPHGGPSDGESVHVGLVYEDAAWRVDSLESDVPVGP